MSTEGPYLISASPSPELFSPNRFSYPLSCSIIIIFFSSCLCESLSPDFVIASFPVGSCYGILVVNFSEPCSCTTNIVVTHKNATPSFNRYYVNLETMSIFLFCYHLLWTPIPSQSTRIGSSCCQLSPVQLLLYKDPFHVRFPFPLGLLFLPWHSQNVPLNAIAFKGYD